MHVAQSSSAHPTVKRRRCDGTQVEVACPSVLPDSKPTCVELIVGINFRHTTTLVGVQRSGRKECFFYIVECAILNSYILDGHIRSAEHARKGRMNCVLKFRRYSSRKIRAMKHNV